MKTLFAALALVAITAPLTLADGQQHYQPPDQQYQQTPGDQQNGYPEGQPQTDYQADQSQTGAPEAQQQSDDQAGDGSGGGYSVDSTGQDRAAYGHKKKRTVGPPQQAAPNGPWGLPPFTGHTRQEWEQYQQQNAAALERQREFYENNVPECPSMPHEDGQAEVDTHESCRIGLAAEAARRLESQKKETLDYATNEYGKCMQGCSFAGQACSSPSEEQWTHGHNDCRGEYDRCSASCSEMYNVRGKPYGIPAK